MNKHSRDGVFMRCPNLKRIKFMGDAPQVKNVRPFDTNVVVEVVEGTKGWDDNRWERYKIKVVPSKSRSFSTGWVIDDDVKVDFDETNDRTKDVMQSTTNSVLGHGYTQASFAKSEVKRCV